MTLRAPPRFGAVPGGPEPLVILLVVVLPLRVPVAALAFGGVRGYSVSRSGSARGGADPDADDSGRR